MGFTFVAVQTASYARIAPSDNGRASAIFSTQRQMSVSIGVALMATVLSGFTPLTAAPTDPQRALEGYHWAFVVLTLLALDRGGDRHPHQGRGRGGDDGRPLGGGPCVRLTSRPVGVVAPAFLARS